MRRIECFGVLAATALLLTSPTWAGLLTDPLNNASLRGDVTLKTALFGQEVHAIVEYAVYEPNVGDSLFDMDFGPSADPTGGEQYVYAYQVFNQVQESSDITSLTVRLQGNEYALVFPPAVYEFIGWQAGTGGHSPTSAEFVPSTGDPGTGTGTPTATEWSFIGSPLPVDTSSDVLFFTAFGSPEMDWATVDGEISASGLVPSPTPEPIALSVLAAGMASCLSKRRKKLPSK